MKKRPFSKILMILLIFLFYFTEYTFSKEQSYLVKAYLDSEKLFVNQEARLTVMVRSDKEVIRPFFLPSAYLKIEYEGSSNPSPTFVNGGVTWERYYLFSVIPESTGIFEIPSAIVKVGGVEVRTDPITVEVVEGEKDNLPEKEPVFVTASISHEEAYINQEIIYTLKFYRRVNVENETLDSPVFEGFIVEQIEPELDYKENVGGVDYYVHEKRIALFPLKIGKLIIPPSKIICDVPVKNKHFDNSSDIAPYYQSVNLERKTFASDVVSVRVSKIPEEGKPANFKNLVGDYSIKAEMTKKEIALGETVSLIVKISGEGNINDVAEPDFPEIKGFKVYKEYPIVKLYEDGNVFAGEKIFKRILFPLSEGRKIIPPISIVYFNPVKKRYLKDETKSIEVNVIKPLAEVQKENVKPDKITFKQNVRQIGEDILPVKLSLDCLKDFKSTPSLKFIAGLLSAPPIIFLFSLLVYFKTQKERKETVKYKQTNAFKIFRASAEKLKNDLNRNSKNLSEELLKTIKDYFGNKLAMEGKALTVAEIEKLMISNGINDTLRTDLTNIIKKVEASAFANIELSRDEIKAVIVKLIPLIKDIDKSL